MVQYPLIVDRAMNLQIVNDHLKINVPNTNAAPMTYSLGRNKRQNKNKFELHSLL